MLFSYEVERDGKLSFLDVNVFREEGQFVNSGVYTHFESFLSATYKFSMVYTLAYIDVSMPISDYAKLNNFYSALNLY